MTMKEKLENILGGFLERNKEYAVELYIDNAVTNSRIGQILITSDRIYETNEKKLTVKWNINHDIKFNECAFQYDQVLACYEETDKYNQQMIYVIMKNGMEFDFGCIGMRI